MTTMQIPDPMTIQLSKGDHKTREEGVCFLEAVAWVAGEPHSDAPSCADPQIAMYARMLNDEIPDAYRNDLFRPLIETVVGSAVQTMNSTGRWHTDLDISITRRDYISARLFMLTVRLGMEAVGLHSLAETLKELAASRSSTVSDLQAGLTDAAKIVRAELQTIDGPELHVLLCTMNEVSSLMHERTIQPHAEPFPPMGFVSGLAARSVRHIAAYAENIEKDPREVWQHAVDLIGEAIAAHR